MLTAVTGTTAQPITSSGHIFFLTILIQFDVNLIQFDVNLIQFDDRISTIAGSLFLVFTSDGSVENSGFVASYAPLTRRRPECPSCTTLHNVPMYFSNAIEIVTQEL